jgi:hypothetical protein
MKKLNYDNKDLAYLYCHNYPAYTNQKRKCKDFFRIVFLKETKEQLLKKFSLVKKKNREEIRRWKN